MLLKRALVRARAVENRVAKRRFLRMSYGEQNEKRSERSVLWLVFERRAFRRMNYEEDGLG